jgi:hypothetical protein
MAETARWRVMLVLAVVGLSLIASCTGTDGGGGGVASAPSTTSSTRTAPSATSRPSGATTDPKAAALSAYRAYWADVVAASQTADFRSSRLDDHARGQPVTAIRDHLRQLQQAGLVDRGDIILAPRVVSLNSTTAGIRDCQDLTGFLKHDAKTGELRDQPSGNRYLAEAMVTRIGSQWKVTQVAQAVSICGKA